MTTKTDVVTVRDALLSATEKLADHVESPRVDGELLLAHVLAWSRAELYANSGHPLSNVGSDLFRTLVMRRRAGEPLQYLTGSQSFRGLDLFVGPGALVPRPETEILVERALGLVISVERPRVLDLGTGCGAIALSIATGRPDAEVWASEVSKDALRWALMNLERSSLNNVQLVEGDLFEPVPGDLKGAFDLVIANPPYLSQAELDAAPPDVRDHEPWVATLSGPSGLEFPTRVIEESFDWLHQGGWLVMETAPQRAHRIRRLLEFGYEEVAIHRDLAGRKRVAVGRRGVG